MALSLKMLLLCLCLYLTFWLFYFVYYSGSSCSNLDDSKTDEELFNENRNVPVVFIIGIKGPSLTLMKDLLNESPNFHCTEDIGYINDIFRGVNSWTKGKQEQERLLQAHITENLLNSATAQFVIEILVKTQQNSKYLCLMAPNLLQNIKHLKVLFPNIKLIFVIRDPRKSVEEMIKQKLDVENFYDFSKTVEDKNIYNQSLTRWNTVMENSYEDCAEINFDKKSCLKGKK